MGHFRRGLKRFQEKEWNNRYIEQYRPDSSLVALAIQRDSKIWVDPYTVDTVVQANALYNIDNEDVNQQSYGGISPLWSACCVGNLRMAAYLCERKADFTIANSEGLAPIHIAVMKGHLNIIQLLLSEGDKKNDPVPDYGIQKQNW